MVQPPADGWLEAHGNREARNGHEDASLLDLSVVVPTRDEQGNVGRLSAEIVSALGGQGVTFEVIFVDDGSADGTWTEVLEASAVNAHVRGIRHRRPFGKAEALRSGIESARGNAIVTMDGDLQDDPWEIPRFLALLAQGYDAVCGWKRIRRDPLAKRLASRAFNAATRWVSRLPLHDFNCGFKAYTTPAARYALTCMYGEMYRYVPIFLAAKGYRVAEIDVNHRPRLFGRSKFGLGRAFRGGWDLLTATLLTRYRSRPLHAFGGVALTAWACGAAAATLLAISGESTLAAVAAIAATATGVSLLSAGLACELIVNKAGQGPANEHVVEAVAIPEYGTKSNSEASPMLARAGNGIGSDPRTQ